MTKRAVGIELARQRARELLHRTPLTKNRPVPIEAVAEALGVELIVTRLDGASAQLIQGAHSASILLSDRLTDAADRRWAIAHELGHLLLDHPASPAAELCRPRPHLQTAKQRDGEAESDAFASALLIRPEAISEIRDVRPMTLGAPALLAERCRVPLTAAAIRITEESLRSCAAVLSERGTIRWVSPSWRFFTRYGATLAPGQPIPSSSTAQHYRDRAAIPWDPCISGRSAWIDRPDWVLVFEHSMPTPEPDTVLTMLWCLDELTATTSDPWLHRAPKFVRDCLLDMLRAAEEIRRSRKELIDIAAQPSVPGDTTWHIGPDGSYARPGFLKLR
jgi:Zn-dependent peptidase ImmA (M78 family)